MNLFVNLLLCCIAYFIREYENVRIFNNDSVSNNKNELDCKKRLRPTVGMIRPKLEYDENAENNCSNKRPKLMMSDSKSTAKETDKNFKSLREVEETSKVRSSISSSFLPPPMPTYCQECCIEFKFVSKYGIHGRICHPGKKIFPCGVDGCHSAFTDPSNLIAHRKEKHRKLKRFSANKNGYSSVIFECLQCNMEFKNAKCLDDHFREWHREEKMYKCGTCEYAFRDRQHWKRHEEIAHAPAKFRCKLCHKNYKTPYYITIHERACWLKRTAAAEAKASKISISGRDRLKKHIRTHQSDEYGNVDFNNEGKIRTTEYNGNYPSEETEAYDGIEMDYRSREDSSSQSHEKDRSWESIR